MDNFESLWMGPVPAAELTTMLGQLAVIEIGPCRLLAVPFEPLKKLVCACEQLRHCVLGFQARLAHAGMRVRTLHGAWHYRATFTTAISLQPFIYWIGVYGPVYDLFHADTLALSFILPALRLWRLLSQLVRQRRSKECAGQMQPLVERYLPALSMLPTTPARRR